MYYKPCHAAGGDYFGFQHFSDDRLGFAVADVSGHGVAAAVMMAVLRTALAAFRVFGRDRENAPQDINLIVNDCQVPGVFVTAVFASLDIRSGNIYLGNCGHPSPRFLRAGGLVESLRGESSVPIGIIDHIAPPMLVAHLHPGDSIILYTDGITEARNDDNELFGEARLDDAIRSAGPGSGGGQVLIDSILKAVDQFQSGLPQSDDRCILVCTRL